jgi:transposase
VIVTHCPQYAYRTCEEAVVQGPAPERQIKGGLPTEAMVAYALVAKLAWHLPLYRQAKMLLAQGLDIKRAVLAFWVGCYVAAELKPLYLRLRELILALGKIAVDESVAPLLDPPRSYQKGYSWGAARDDRPWSGTDPRAIAYTFAPGRGAVHALKILEHYRGSVQCDGYAVYKANAGQSIRLGEYRKGG